MRGISPNIWAMAAFRGAVQRVPRPEEIVVLAELLAKHRTHYTANVKDAR